MKKSAPAPTDSSRETGREADDARPNSWAIVFALFDNVTQLDFTGPLQVLSRLPGATIRLASARGGELTSDAGLTFSRILRLSDCRDCDILVVPGGQGQIQAMADQDYMQEIRRLGGIARFVTSVCTGSLILGAAGFLKGRRATCHWAARDLLRDLGAIPDDARVVEDGNVVTGAGVTAGIDFALTLVARLAGQRTAEAIQLGLEYAPMPPFSAGRPETAPADVLAEALHRLEAATEIRRRQIAALTSPKA